MFTKLRRYRSVSVAAIGVALTVTLAACGGSSSASLKVASLGGSGADGATTTSVSQTPQQAALAFVACLRQQGLTVNDPTFDANGNPQGNILAGLDRTNPATRTALRTCRTKLGGVTFGGGRRFDPTVIQNAYNDFTACLRSKGLNVKDITFGRPRGASGAGGAGGNGGAPDGSGPAGGGFRGGGFGGGSGPGGQGFNPTTRLIQQLGLDTTDPKVQAAVTACQPIITQAFTSATSTTVAN
jgi:hypothetical protein